MITVLTFRLNHIVVSNFQSLRNCGRIIEDLNPWISITLKSIAWLIYWQILSYKKNTVLYGSDMTRVGHRQCSLQDKLHTSSTVNTHFWYLCPCTFCCRLSADMSSEKSIISCSHMPLCCYLQRIPHPTSNTLLVPIVMVFGSTPSVSGKIFSG